jgi:DNA-directed RNA polymerase subunit M/transcription elongation factor TFIIS
MVIIVEKDSMGRVRKEVNTASLVQNLKYCKGCDEFLPIADFNRQDVNYCAVCWKIRINRNNKKRKNDSVKRERTKPEDRLELIRQEELETERIKEQAAEGGRKVCSVCKQEKDVSEFLESRVSDDGYFHECKTCLNKILRK